MRGLAIRFMALVVLALLVTSEAETPALAQNQAEIWCPGGTLTTSFDAPPPGMASFRTISFDENCNQIIGPVQTVPIAQLPEIALDSEARHTLLRDLNTGASISRRAATTYHAEQAILDPVNITLNRLYSDINFGYDGSSILSYSAGGGTTAHGENSPPSCGNGWYAQNAYSSHITGGVGQSSAGFRYHAEFGYLGAFDCSGNIYYNTLDNYPTVYGNGTGTCNFANNYRTWSHLWHWTSACY